MSRSVPVKVLCLDDDAAVAGLVATLVDTCGCVGIVLTDPFEVGAYMTDPAVKAVLSDFFMPQRDGLEVLQEVQKLRPEVRRILVTAAPHEHPVREALRTGRVHYVVSKPLSLLDINTALSGV